MVTQTGDLVYWRFQEDGFKPVRRVWNVGRLDLGRQWAIVQTLEDTEGNWVAMETVRITQIPQGMHGVLTGMSGINSQYTHAEAQQLMNALWEAGLRPSHRANATD